MHSDSFGEFISNLAYYETPSAPWPSDHVFKAGGITCPSGVALSSWEKFGLFHVLIWSKKLTDFYNYCQCSGSLSKFGNVPRTNNKYCKEMTAKKDNFTIKSELTL